MADNGSVAEALHLPNLAGELPAAWTWKRLDKACFDVIDCPHSTPKIAPFGPLMVRSQDIRSGVFLVDQAARVSEETYKNRTKRSEPTYGDLVYSREGTYFGIAAEVPKDTRVCLGQRMVLLRPDPKQIQHRYLKYWLNSPVLQSHIHGHRDGTVAERLNMPTIRALPVPVAPIRVQERIADILGTLDDKIELNRRMNETLEAMARRMFRSWFVDFDPVHAKATLRRQHPKLSNADLSRRTLPNMAPEIAELFPDSFEDSTLGPIPKGWEAGTVADIGDNPRRGVQPSDIPAATPYIALEHMPRRCISLSNWGHADDVASGKFHFNKGEILFGKLRPYFHKVGVPAIDGVCSTDVLVIVPKETHWFGVLLGNVTSDEMIAHTDTSSTGTKMPRTNWGDIARFDFAIPTKEIAEAATQQVAKLVDRIHANIFESRELARTRDKLLRPLLSGELVT